MAFVAETGQASISLIQRRFRIGYNRAARIVEKMEARDALGAQTALGAHIQDARLRAMEM